MSATPVHPPQTSTAGASFTGLSEPHRFQPSSYTERLGNSAVKSSTSPPPASAARVALERCLLGTKGVPAFTSLDPPEGQGPCQSHTSFTSATRVKSAEDDSHRCLTAVGSRPSPALLRMRSLGQQHSHQRLRDANPGGPVPSSPSTTVPTARPPMARVPPTNENSKLRSKTQRREAWKWELRKEPPCSVPLPPAL